ncbi:MFS transporter [Saccharopolyspora sp. NPDC047091]|uniref:MFS transporter n=1 Tax=Saccharopolyspora sp. NPDC047091 TaxID=3155924 RepID=UPI0033E2891A
MRRGSPRTWPSSTGARRRSRPRGAERRHRVHTGLGGEGTAAQVMALEHAPVRRRALVGSLVNLGSPLGQVLVSVVLLAMTALLGAEAFLAWGRRLPFFLGCALAVGGYFVRRRMDESPVFENAAARGGTSASPVRTVFRSHPRVIVRLTFLRVPNIACSYLVTTCSLEYLHGALGLPSGTGFALVLVTNLLGVAAIPLGGWLADRFGRKPVLYSFAALSLVGTLVYFPLLDTKSWPLMLLANAVALVSDYVEFGVLAVLFAERFPTPLRFSGHAAVYTLTNMVGGSPTPLVAALLLSVTGSPWSIALLLAAAYAVSLVPIHRTPETRDREFGAS